MRIASLIALILSTTATAQIAPFGDPFGGGQSFADTTEAVNVTITPDRTEVPRGADLRIAVVLDIAPGWHIWPGPVEIGEEYATFDGAIRTEAGWSVMPEGAVEVHADFAAWPEVHGFESDLTGEGVSTYPCHEKRAVIFVPATVAEDAPLGEVTLTVGLTMQACDATSCVQPAFDEPYSVTITVVEGEGGAVSDEATFADFPADLFDRIRGGEEPPPTATADGSGGGNVKFDLFGWEFEINAAGAGLVLLSLVAAFGGLLLNFTPCVLPVIPIKIMSLSQSAGNRSRTFMLGLSMCLGVIGFWLGLGGAIAGISGFTSTNELFQYPAFTMSVGVVIAVLAIGMCGLFSVRLPQFVYRINPGHDSLHGSFGFGVMTAVLSTPCTAPFMGAAAAWAAGQSAAIVLTVFAAIGAGMAAPYLVLAASPGLVRKMPKTGPASELIKQVMGLLMLAAAAYFFGTGLSGALVTPPEPPSRTYLWIAAAFAIAAGGWLAWRTIRITPSAIRRVFFGGIGVAIMGISILGANLLTDKGPIDWVYYTEEAFAEAKSDGNVVVMEFTAEWCLNCKALENTVLRTESIADLLAEDDVVPIKVDITGNNAAGDAMLNATGRRSIPLLVVFAPDGSEVFKSDFYTVEQVREAVATARGG